MEGTFSSGLVQVTLAVILVLILPSPASPAPLALRVRVPLDMWRPVVIQPRPTSPAKPSEQINLSVTKPLDDDGDEDGEDWGEDDGDKPAWRLKFRGMNLPRQFGAYDLDHSRGVSLVELATVTETELKDAKEPFNAADLDGNKVLSQEEFTQAPWIFDASGITMLDSAMDGGDIEEARQS
ncbi:uncharacterized protein LOC110983841 [Acanthaster planci]|uniref:Uncharacterized protein LOC110983841 n=1 Tax=Acanthaster planci TaxID=133434 RepID=A0A8B7Z731_ACAPL|nr:uncharacterized protein LOC110983841 [Acanthaster planci]